MHDSRGFERQLVAGELRPPAEGRVYSSPVTLGEARNLVEHRPPDTEVAGPAGWQESPPRSVTLVLVVRSGQFRRVEPGVVQTADDHGVKFQGAHHDSKPIWPDLVIGVAERQQLALRCGDRDVPGVSTVGRPGGVYPPQRKVVLPPLHDGDRAVAAAVVGNDDLPAVGEVLAGERGELSADRGLHIADRDDHSDDREVCNSAHDSSSAQRAYDRVASALPATQARARSPAARRPTGPRASIFRSALTHAPPLFSASSTRARRRASGPRSREAGRRAARPGTAEATPGNPQAIPSSNANGLPSVTVGSTKRSAEASNEATSACHPSTGTPSSGCVLRCTTISSSPAPASTSSQPTSAAACQASSNRSRRF